MNPRGIRAKFSKDNKRVFIPKEFEILKTGTKLKKGDYYLDKKLQPLPLRNENIPIPQTKNKKDFVSKLWKDTYGVDIDENTLTYKLRFLDKRYKKYHNSYNPHLTLEQYYNSILQIIKNANQSIKEENNKIKWTPTMSDGKDVSTNSFFYIRRKNPKKELTN